MGNTSLVISVIGPLRGLGLPNGKQKKQTRSKTRSSNVTSTQNINYLR